jgi:hypothetical protein
MPRYSGWSLVVVLAALVGCHGDPPPPGRPPLVPAEMARRAMELYDTNHDGRIDAAELTQSPALAALAASLGPQAAEGLTEEQLARRAEAWLKSPSGLVPQRLAIDLDERPLAGASVTLEPDACMGPAYYPASATTDAAGQCCPGVDPRYGGLWLGLYRIRISKLDGGRETIPARYNAQSELGLETDPTRGSRGAYRQVHLHSRL